MVNLGIKNSRIKRHREDTKGEIPVLAYSPKGKEPHCIERLCERLPLEVFSFSIRSLNEMIKRGEATLGKNQEGKKRIFFSVVMEQYGEEWQRDFKVGVKMKNGKVKKIKTVMKRDREIPKTKREDCPVEIFDHKMGDLMEAWA